MTERITVFSDYVCPFCYLGRASLDRYQKRRETPLEVDWHPFDLRANKRNSDGSIDHGVDDGKGEDYFAEVRENVRDLQERYDAEMAQEVATDVDSLPAQVLSYHVHETADYETWLALDEAIFAALWEEGRDIGDTDVLVDVADSAGLDAETVEEVLADEDLRAEVRDLFTEANRSGVTGVPTFVYDGHAARGAVPPEHLERLVEEA